MQMHRAPRTSQAVRGIDKGRWNSGAGGQRWGAVGEQGGGREDATDGCRLRVAAGGPARTRVAHAVIPRRQLTRAIGGAP